MTPEWTTTQWRKRRRPPRPKVRHQSRCRWSCGGVFRCARCRGYFGWCLGSDNDYCDPCSCALEAVRGEDDAYEGDWQSIQFVARWHPDPDTREIWESIDAGLYDEFRRMPF